MDSNEVYRADLSAILAQGGSSQIELSSIRGSTISKAVLGALVRSRLNPSDHLLVIGTEADSTLDQLHDDIDFDISGTQIGSFTQYLNREQKLSRMTGQCTIEGLNFTDSRFDVVACIQDYSSLTGLRATFSELLRITKLGGSLCTVIHTCRRPRALQEMQRAECADSEDLQVDVKNMFLESEAQCVVRVPCARTSLAFLVKK